MFREFEEQVEERRVDDIPDSFDGNRHAQAYYGVFKKMLPELFAGLSADKQNRWVDIAFSVDEIVTTAVAEHSINPQNIEAQIRKMLLPLIFKECKDIGAGMVSGKIYSRACDTDYSCRYRECLKISWPLCMENERIEFTRSQRSGDVTRVLIKVHPDCRVVANAPINASNQDVIDAVKKRARWIHGKLEKFREQIAHVTPRRYVSGERSLLPW